MKQACYSATKEKLRSLFWISTSQGNSKQFTSLSPKREVLTISNECSVIRSGYGRNLKIGPSCLRVRFDLATMPSHLYFNHIPATKPLCILKSCQKVGVFGFVSRKGFQWALAWEFPEHLWKPDLMYGKLGIWRSRTQIVLENVGVNFVHLISPIYKKCCRSHCRGRRDQSGLKKWALVWEWRGPLSNLPMNCSLTSSKSLHLFFAFLVCKVKTMLFPPLREILQELSNVCLVLCLHKYFYVYDWDLPKYSEDIHTYSKLNKYLSFDKLRF